VVGSCFAAANWTFGVHPRRELRKVYSEDAKGRGRLLGSRGAAGVPRWLVKITATWKWGTLHYRSMNPIASGEGGPHESNGVKNRDEREKAEAIFDDRGASGMRRRG
jgi:hypothetical protein